MDRASKKILEEKKKKFLIEVDKSAEYWGVTISEVKFWEKYDNKHFKDGERAHIHTDKRIICIAEPELERMTYDDIVETANHEVSHVQHSGHDTDFQDSLQKSKTGTWESPSGIAHIGGKSYRDDKSSPSKEKINKTHCGECNKMKGIKKCEYCERYFCPEHINARIPFVGHYLKMDRDETPNSHPCFQFAQREDKRIEKERAKYAENLGKLLSKPRYENHHNDTVFTFPEKEAFRPHGAKEFVNTIPEEKDYGITIHKDPIRHKGNNKKIGWIITIIVLLMIGVVIYLSLPKIYSYTAGNPTFGGFLNNPLESRESSNAMFSELNYFRRVNLVQSLTFSRDTYNFAVSIAREYSSTGMSPPESDIQAKLGNYHLSDVKYLFTQADTKDQGVENIKSWEGSALISAILKDNNYSYGAIGCFGKSCALVLSNTASTGVSSSNINIKSLSPASSPIATTVPSTVRLIPSEMEEYGFYKDSQRSCAAVEAIGESSGISDFKGKICREACGKRNMDFNSYDCPKDLFVCYCTV